MADQVTHLMHFNVQLARAFKRRYLKAVADGAEQFSFNGGDFLTSYAKYVCEYLATKGLLP